MTFGGRIWPINPEDMNLGRVSDGSTMCVGGISVVQGMNDSTWIVGGPFLKSVHSVFRLEPPSVGFAELSFEGGGTSGECYSLTYLFYWKCVPPGLPRSGNESGDANNGSDPNNGKNNNAGADGEQPVLLHASVNNTDKGTSLSQLLSSPRAHLL